MVLLGAILSSATVWAENVSIGTVAEWNTFAGRVNDGETTLGGLLTADIDFDDGTFTIVGTSANPFCGTFDGAGHTVKGISVSKSGDVTANRQGLFGSVGSGGFVRNVTVTGSSFAGWDYVGGIAGYNQGGTIENCHVTSSVTIGTTAMSKQYHGGIVGYNSSIYSTVSHCTSAATVTDNGQTSCHNFGGIVGSNSGGTVEHCLAVGATVSAVTNSGAIVGQNSGTLSCNYYGNCTVGEATSNIGTNTGDITANDGAVPAIILYDHGTKASGNGTTITDNTGSGKNVALYGRTLYKDGKWNTLCLPFGLTSLTGTPLEGATVKTLTSTGFADGTLTLNFSDAPSIEAGKPYLVKWASSDNILNPVFTGVTIENEDPADKTTPSTYVDFIGTYSPVVYDDVNRSVLFMGSGSTLYYPDGTKTTTIGACRAYFTLKNGITAGDPATGGGIKAFVLNFGDENADGVVEVQGSRFKVQVDDAWYDLSGRNLDNSNSKIQNSKLPRGIYIHNGKKTIVK